MCNVLCGFLSNQNEDGSSLTGSITIQGKPLEELNAAERTQTIGFIFQNPFVQVSGIKETVFDEIAFGLENIGIPKNEMESRVTEIISLLGIEQLSQRDPVELSGGQRQKVPIASILVMEPEIVIFDEPTSQLDPAGTEAIFEIIQMLKSKGKTVVLVEHKIDLIADYADKLLLLDKGELFLAGTTLEVLTDERIKQHGLNPPVITNCFQQLSRSFRSQQSIPVTLKQAVDLLEGESL